MKEGTWTCNHTNCHPVICKRSYVKFNERCFRPAPWRYCILPKFVIDVTPDFEETTTIRGITFSRGKPSGKILEPFFLGGTSNLYEGKKIQFYPPSIFQAKIISTDSNWEWSNHGRSLLKQYQKEQRTHIAKSRHISKVTIKNILQRNWKNDLYLSVPENIESLREDLGKHYQNRQNFQKG